MPNEPFVRATEATLKSLMGLSARHSSELVADMLRAGRDPEEFVEEPLDKIAELIGSEGSETEGDIVSVIAPAGTTTVWCRISERRYYVGPVPVNAAEKAK